MAPAFLRISIQRERASATSRDAHEIGIIGGTVGGGVSKTGADRGPSTRWETRWVADSLVFASATFDPDEPHTGKWAERVETWSLEPDGRLRVEIATESSDRARETSILLYRRE